MNVKIDRLESLFEREISSILHNEIRDENIQFVGVTGVELTKDLVLAKIYVTCLKLERKDETMKALNHASKYIKGELSRRIEHIRKMPDLRFIYDDSIEYGSKIDQLINGIKKEDEGKSE